MRIPRNAEGREGDALPRRFANAHVGKSELAPRLNSHSAPVDRVLDLNHGSRLDQIDAALAADALRLDVGVAAIHSGSPAAATNDDT